MPLWRRAVGALRRAWTRTRVSASVVRNAVAAGARSIIGLHRLLPQIVYALIVNRRVRKNYVNQVEDAWDRAAQADDVSVDAAVALWQFETDRLNGLATKAAAVLAADALVAAGVGTQTSSKGIALYACIAAIAYLVSAAVSACLVQMPMQRFAVQPKHVLEGTATEEMVAVVIANEPVGIQLQNLVSVGVRDTFVSLVLLLAVLAIKLVS